MSFEDQIATLSRRVPRITEHLKTEEASKNALVMPFIAALGYDIFDPQEVIPEFVADVSAFDGEKLDFAVDYKGDIIMIVECLKPGADLGRAKINKLQTYFQTTRAKIAVLTDGMHYRFYKDAKAPGKMDINPFVRLDLKTPRPEVLEEINKFSKENIDLERWLSAPSEREFISACVALLERQFEAPDKELVKYFVSSTNPGTPFTESVREVFTPLLAKALKQFIRDKIGERLQVAIDSGPVAGKADASALEGVLTAGTETGGNISEADVIAGYHIVKAIVALPKVDLAHETEIEQLKIEIDRLTEELELAQGEALLIEDMEELLEEAPPPVPGAKISCDRFELVLTKVDDATLGITLDTDLPDMTEIVFNVSRAYHEKGDSAAYPVEYSTEQTTVGKWRKQHNISIDNRKWIALLQQKQKELSRLGLGLNVGSVNQNIKIKMEVPIQEDPRFGKANSKLVGKEVKTSGPRVIKKEILLDYPLEPSLLDSIDMPSLDPRGLDEGATYVLSEDTPIMTSPGTEGEKKIPAQCAIQILKVAQQKGTPVYKVAVFDQRRSNVGQAWVSSMSLVGQRLDIAE